MIDSVGTIEKVKRLKFPTVKERIIETKQKLDQYNNGINQWDFPVVFSKEKVAYLDLYDKFKAARDEVRRHEVAVTRIHEQKVLDAGLAKGQWRGERNKLRNHFHSRQCPDAIAKNVADAWWASVSPPAKLQIALTIFAPECLIDSTSTLVSFSGSFVVKYDAARLECDSTPLQRAFAKTYLENHDTALSLQRECVAVMRAPPVRSSCIGLFDLKSQLDFGVGVGDGSQPLITYPAGLPAAFWSNKAEVVNLSYQANPFKMLPCFMQSIMGKVAMVVVNSDLVEKSGDIATYVAAADATELAKEATYLLDVGDTVWVPPRCGSRVSRPPAHDQGPPRRRRCKGVQAGPVAHLRARRVPNLCG